MKITGRLIVWILTLAFYIFGILFFINGCKQEIEFLYKAARYLLWHIPVGIGFLILNNKILKDQAEEDAKYNSEGHKKLQVSWTQEKGPSGTTYDIRKEEYVDDVQNTSLTTGIAMFIFAPLGFIFYFIIGWVSVLTDKNFDFFL